jgi:hypothetical protein
VETVEETRALQNWWTYSIALKSYKATRIPNLESESLEDAYQLNAQLL